MKENMYSHGTGKISGLLNRHEFLGFTPTILLINVKWLPLCTPSNFVFTGNIVGYWGELFVTHFIYFTSSI
jgi:hypothetical protein